MGVDRCGWVRWGAGDMRGTKTKQAGGIYGLKGQDLGAMAGEISPDIMFWEGRQKVARMGVDGYRSVRMGVYGHICKEGSKNKTKSAPNRRAGDVLRCMVVAKKNMKTTGTIMVTREEQGEQ